MSMGVDFGSFAANAWGNAFLRNLASELKLARADRRHLLNKVWDDAQRLFHERSAQLTNRKSRLIYGLCSLVLAGFREILTSTGDRSKAFESVRRAFRRTHAAPAKWITRLMLLFSKDPARSLARRSIAAFAQKMYGPTMGFAQEPIDGGVDLIVNRCSYHAFFVEHGEPELTRVFCEWDRNWMDAVNGSSRPIKVERPSTISTGGDCCRFRFVHQIGQANGQATDVVLPGRVATPVPKD